MIWAASLRKSSSTDLLGDKKVEVFDNALYTDVVSRNLDRAMSEDKLIMMFPEFVSGKGIMHGGPFFFVIPTGCQEWPDPEPRP